jgi:metal-dependent hydrolase (beta-lactamase superfamily II)
MEVTVLVDNTALFDRMFVAEHGFSVYIEAEGKRILFDTGYSDAFLKNAQKMKIDLFDLDYIVLSHGHFDHPGGLWHLLRQFMEAAIDKTPHRLPRLMQEVFSLLVPGGTFLIAEPKHEVPSDEFETTLAMAASAGFRRVGTPFVLRSRTALFRKD